MAFPTVAATNTSTSVNTTSHSVNLPASISAGDLLIMALYLLDDDLISVPTITTPSGWTALGTVDDGVSRKLAVFDKVASGGEGASVTVSTSATDLASGAHWSARITGYTGTPEIATATAIAAAPNPPNLTPSWGALDTLWLAVGADTNNAADMTAPTNYTNIVQAWENATSNNNLAFARRELNAASENPGTFGGSDISITTLAATIAIQPVAAGQPARKRMAGVPYAAQQAGVW